MPHGATLDDEGNIWVLSNGVGGQTPSYFEGYRVQEEELNRFVQFGPQTEGAHSAGLGSVIRSNDGALIVNWGIYGQIEERDLEGNTKWLIESNLQEVYGFSRVFAKWNP